MKVLIIATNQERSPMPVMPIGAVHAAGAVRNQGHDVQLLDLFWEEDPVQKIQERIRDFRPEVIGFSMRNVDNTDMFLNVNYLDYNRKLVEAAKAVSTAPIVMGGAGFSLFARELIEYMGVPYGVAGEGEIAFPRLIDALQSSVEPAGIPGVYFRKENAVQGTSPVYIRDLASLATPAFDLIDAKPYLEEAGPLAIEGRRGCNLHCMYCAEKGPAGFRLRPVGKVVDEIETAVTKFGITNFSFTDGVLNYPADQGKAICQEIIDRKLQITWAAMVNPIDLDAEIVQLMKRAGCSFLSFGLDAASETMLANYQKDFTKKDIARAAKLFDDARLQSVTTLLFGGPGETEDTIQESLDHLSSLPLGMVYLCLGVRIYAGTELATIAQREGFIDSSESLMVPKFYLSPVLGSETMRKLDEYCRTKETWLTASLAAEMLSEGFSLG